MRIKEKFEHKLLVEGNDDQHVIWALCEKFKISESFDVIDCEGIDNLYKQIPIRIKQSQIKTLGIIIDADSDIKNRWDSLKIIFSEQGFKIPDELPSLGLISTNIDSFKIGVWIMPNNNLNGMLEDFISFLVPKDDKLLPIVISTLEGIENKRLNKYTLTHKSKAIIHSWLSWQEVPGTPMGLSITKKYLTTEEKNCSLLIKWLENLFQT